MRPMSDARAGGALMVEAPSFAAGGGKMGALLREHDWSRTALGPLETWPQSLRTTVGLILHSVVPIVLLWGEDGIMIYNDAYSVFAGGRHPALFGSKVREGWPEVADFNDNVMKVGLAGGTLAYQDQELTLYRTGRAEQVWMNLDYSPVARRAGQPGRRHRDCGRDHRTGSRGTKAGCRARAATCDLSANAWLRRRAHRS